MLLVLDVRTYKVHVRRSERGMGGKKERWLKRVGNVYMYVHVGGCARAHVHLIESLQLLVLCPRSVDWCGTRHGGRRNEEESREKGRGAGSKDTSHTNIA